MKTPHPSSVKFLVRRASFGLFTLLFSIGLPAPACLQAQAPTLNYSSPQMLTTSIAVSISPTSTGVASPANSNVVLVSSGLNHPMGTAVDAAGNVYISDTGDLQVVKLPAGGGQATVLISGFTCEGVAADASGNIYIANADANTLIKVPAGGGSYQTLTQGLRSPMGVAVDAAGYIYVSTRTDNSVYRIQPGGGQGALVASGFSNIAGVAVDASGYVYVADNAANAIYKVPATGGSKIVAGNVRAPLGVAVDGLGNIYAGDITDGWIVTIPAGGGTPTTNETGYASPGLLTSDAFGNVFVPFVGISDIMVIKHTGGYYTNSLPPGLTLNNSTGVISGTPTASSNSQTYTIQAYNGNGSATTTVSMQVVGTGLLSNLSLSAGAISPAFSPATNSYNTTVPGGTAALQIIPKTSDTNAVIKVNGNVVKSGTRSAAVPLVQGANNISVVVTPVNGSANTYTINANSPTSPLPAVSYSSPQTYPVNTAITPLSPYSNQVSGYGYNNNPTSSTPVGAYPVGVASDASNNLYVVYYKYCLAKIPAGAGSPVIMSYNVSNVYQIVADAAGNVYGCDTKNNLLVKYPSGGGDPVTLASGLNFPGAPAMDPAGNFYIPQLETNSIVKVPAGGGNPITAYSIREPLRICFDAQGNAYISAFDGPELGDLYEYPADGSARILIASDLNEVGQMAADAAGNVLVAGFNQYSMLSLYLAGSHQEILLGSDQNASFGVALDAAGNAYAVNGEEMPVYKFAPTGGYFINGLPRGLSFNCNTGVLSGTPTLEGPAANYTVTGYNASGSASSPLSIMIAGNPQLKSLLVSNGSFTTTFSPSSTKYLTEVSNDQTQYYLQPTAYDNTAVIKVNGITVPSGTISPGIPLAIGLTAVSVTVTTADGSVQTYNITVARGSSGFSYAGPQTWYKNSAFTPVSPAVINQDVGSPGYYQTVVTSTLTHPGKLAIDRVNNIYVCDQNTLKKIPGDGSAITTINTNVPTLTGIDVDATGNIYLPDKDNNAIKKITIPSGAVSTVTSGLNKPVDLVVDPSGNIFFIEQGDNALKELQAGSNTVTTLATVNNPSALTMDAAGNFYIGDQQDNVVYKIPSGGGSPVTIGSGFNTLEDVSADATGDVYVTEGTGTGVKMIPSSGGAPFAVVNFSSQAEADGVIADASGELYYSNYFSSSSTSNITKNARTGGYTMLDILPAGVTVDYTTGVISGTPTVSAPAKNYRILAYGPLNGNLSSVNIDIKSSYLTSLAPNTGALSPAYSPAVSAYAMTVCNATNTLALTPTAADPTAVITINGASVTSGSASGNILLNVGANTVTIKSITTDTSTYTLSVTRLAGPSVAITGSFCQSCNPQSLFFRAKVTNGGSSSTYTWYKNNVVVGTSDSTYLDNTLVAGDQIWCAITSNASCVLSNTITSNIVTLGAPAISSISPAYGPPGTLVTITGSNFETLTSLSVAGVSAIPVTNYGAQLTAMIMPGAATGNATATTIYGSASGGGFITNSTTPPTVQQGAKITVSGATGNSALGRFLATSADGNTAVSNGIVSGSAAVIFTRSNGVWTQQAVLKGTGATGVAFGVTAVAINADGNTVIVGDESDNSSIGACWIFTRSNGVWTQQGNKLVPSDAIYSSGLGSEFGSAVALSADGNTALIGGTDDNTYVGAAWIFNRSANGTWTQNGSKLTGSGATGSNSMLGNAVALSADGNTALVDGHYDNNRAGAVWVFVNNNGTWAQQGSKLVGSGAVGTTGAEQGVSMAISADGNTAFWGGFHDNSGLGAAWAFARTGTTWTQQGNKLVATDIKTAAGVSVDFGQSVALSADGNTAAIGAPDDNSYTGAAWLFTRSGGAWSQYGAKVTASDEIVKNFSAGLGQTVALSADGKKLMAGDPSDNNSAGALWAFVPQPIASLSNLVTSSGTIAPAFISTTTAYAASVANNIKTIAITPTATDPAATITVNGTTVVSGSASGNIALAVGPNLVTIVVKASDNTTTNTYTIDVLRASSNDADLSSLALSAGTLSPGFATATTRYSVSVSNATSSIAVTPTTDDPEASVTINGVPVASGAASASIPLSTGANTIAVVVSASDTTTQKTYTITVTRALGSNANLSAIGPSATPLSPNFNPNTTSYTLSVPNATATMTVTPVTVDAGATLKVNGSTWTSGATTGPITLNEGATTAITIAVTSQNGLNTKTYIINVTRAPSNNANLSGIGSSITPLSPNFAPNTTSYSISVPNATASMTLTPVTADANATIKVNGTAITSGATSATIALAEGVTTAVTTVVTAQDGTTVKTYTINVTRAASNNASLTTLGSSITPLTPFFGPNITSYTLSVANNKSSITLTPVAADANAIISVNGNVVASGTTSAPIGLTAGGQTTITITVTSQDGSVTKTYTLRVTRATSADAGLASINPQYGPLSPVFYTATTSYSLSVANSKSTITVAPVANDPNATIKVNGTALASGATSSPIALAEGTITTVSVVVTAQDGTTMKTYTIAVTRAPSNDATLTSMNPSLGPLSPAFYTTTTGYTLSVANSKTSITVTPVATDANATITVNGSALASGAASAPIALAEGATTNVNVVVTAQDGTTTKTYTIGVTRAPSGDASLAGMNPQYGPLSPVFNTNTTSYTESLANTKTSMTVAPVTTDANAKITVNGTAQASGATSAPIPLAVGANTISVVVTAQDGTTKKTYTITVTRASGGADAFGPVSVTQPEKTVTLAEDGIKVHQGISPNGDGIEDFLQIDNIGQYPDNHLKIMNRNGQLVFEAKGYDNQSRIFDGHSIKTGKMQLPGTYFYELDYTVNGAVKHKTGFIVLKY